MKAKLDVSPQAKDDLRNAAAYIEQSNPDAALRFVAAADQTFGWLTEMPESAGLWESSLPRLSGIRVWPIRGFENYLVLYRYARGTVRISRVLHGARDIDTLLNQ